MKDWIVVVAGCLVYAAAFGVVFSTMAWARGTPGPSGAPLLWSMLFAVFYPVCIVLTGVGVLLSLARGDR
jgi:hypothetical protein